MALILDGTAGITTPALSNSGNLTFTGTGNRITGDFSNATQASRVLFQTSTTNANTNITAIPNGTGTRSNFNAYNASDPANGGYAQIGCFATEAAITSGALGTGTYLPMTFYTGGSERMRIDTSGNVGVLAQLMAGTTTVYSDGAIGTPRLQWNAKAGTYVGAVSIADTASALDHWVLRNTNGNVASIGTNGTSVTFNTASTERMRIDSSGNVGIGVTPTYKFEVRSGTYSQFSVATDVYTSVMIGRRPANDTYASLVFNAGGASFPKIEANNIDLTFYTGNAERMRIDSSGNLLVGTTSQIRSSSTPSIQIASSGGEQIIIRNTSAAAGRLWRLATDNNNTMYIINQDTLGAYIANGASTWSGLSDENLKTALVPIENAAEKVMALRAVTGRYKTDEENVSRAFLIAQDVQKVLPEAVNAASDVGLGLQYTDVIPLLVAAIKELTARIEQLEAK